MIIWGYKTKEIGAKHVRITCPNCQKDSLLLVAYMRIFSLYYIPTFPYKKFSLLFCEGCGASYELEGFKNNPELKDMQIKYPWGAFTGLILIALFASFIFFDVRQYTNKVEAFKKAPVAGRALIISLPYELRQASDLPYTYVKVEHVDEKEVRIRPGVYTFSKDRMANRYARSSEERYWSDETISMERENFDALEVREVL